jgi:hypothetical protein
MANGKAGALNQYGRYFSGRGTLDEKPIPREDGRRAETAAFKRRKLVSDLIKQNPVVLFRKLIENEPEKKFSQKRF